MSKALKKINRILASKESFDKEDYFDCLFLISELDGKEKNLCYIRTIKEGQTGEMIPLMEKASAEYFSENDPHDELFEINWQLEHENFF